MGETYGDTIIAKDIDGEARVFSRNAKGEWVEADFPDFLPRHGETLYGAIPWARSGDEKVQMVEYGCEMSLMQSYLAGHLWKTPSEALRKLEIDRLIAATASHRLFVDEYGSKEDYDATVFYNITTQELQIDMDSGDNARWALVFKTEEDAQFFINSITADEFLKFVALIKHKGLKERKDDNTWN